MSQQELLPEKWNPILEELKIKNDNKYTPKIQASTDDFECLKCLDVERKKAKMKKEKSTEMNIHNVLIINYKLEVLMNQ